MKRKFSIEFELLQGLDEETYFEIYEEVVSMIPLINKKINGMRLIGEVNLVDITVPFSKILDSNIN